MKYIFIAWKFILLQKNIFSSHESTIFGVKIYCIAFCYISARFHKPRYCWQRERIIIIIVGVANFLSIFAKNGQSNLIHVLILVLESKGPYCHYTKNIADILSVSIRVNDEELWSLLAAAIDHFTVVYWSCPCFSCVNYAVLMLTSRKLHK